LGFAFGRNGYKLFVHDFFSFPLADTAKVGTAKAEMRKKQRKI
jgi:hypothetical protein